MLAMITYIRPTQIQVTPQTTLASNRSENHNTFVRLNANLNKKHRTGNAENTKFNAIVCEFTYYPYN